MKKIILLLTLVTLWGSKAQASNLVYISQSGAGDQSGLTDCTHAKPVTYFNTGGNWSGTPTGVQIGPDTTVHLCGTITTSLSWQGSGTSGHPITMFFETGAKLMQAFCGAGGGSACMTLNGNAWWIIDGGVACGTTAGGIPSGITCNGQIGTNNNGTVLANQNGDNPGLDAGGTNQGEIKNLEVGPIYVRTSTTDEHPDSGNNEKPWAIGLSGGSFTGSTNISIHDGKVHDANWSITMLSEFVNNGPLTIYNEDSYNDNHAIAVGVLDNSSLGITIHDMHFGSMVNWDDVCPTPCNFHHDGFHAYTNAFDGRVIFNLYNSLFDGDWGLDTTAHIFAEGSVSGNIFNNVFITQSNRNMSNGSFNNINNASGGTNVKTIGFYNNSLIYLTTANVNGSPLLVSGTVDVRNNAITYANTNSPNIVSGQGATGTWDYNAYASPLPSSQLFTITGSGNQLTYAQWKATPLTPDSHSPAIQSPPMNLNTVTGVPQAGPPLNAGFNLTSLGIAALNADKNGVARPSTGPWTIGALNPGNTPPAPGLAITPNPASFGSVNVGSGSSPVTLTVTSNATATATLSASIATFSDPQFARTGGTCTPSQSLIVGATCTIIGVFTPTSAGVKNATITVGANTTASAGLSGTGTAGTASMSATPSNWNFGNVTQGTPSAIETFVVTNTGSTSITMSTPVTTFSGTNAGDFTLSGVPTNQCTSGLILAPGGTCQKSIIVTPSIIGAESATATFSSTTASVLATLTATGTAVSIPSLLVTPRPLILSPTVQGQTSPTVTGTITNNGNVSVTLVASNPITITGALLADFSLSSNACTPNLVLAVGATCTFNVSAIPSGVTLEQVNLTVTATNTTNTVALQIQGLPIAPIPAPSPAFIISTQIDLFPMPKVTITGLNFVVGKTQITIDGSPQATICASTTSCTTILSSAVLLPWLWGNWARDRSEIMSRATPASARQRAQDRLLATDIQQPPRESSPIFAGRSSWRECNT
jgi:hypothetical protein